MSIKKGDWIYITEGGWGTYSENIGCICEVEEIYPRGSIKIGKTRLNKIDGASYEILAGGFRLATPREIPQEEILNKEPRYEIY